MSSIDAFIQTPLLVSAILGIVLFLFLLIIKLRNTAKVSFIFYLADGLLVAGAFYSYLAGHVIYFIFSIVIATAALVPYLILKAFDNPQKREAKRAAKFAAEKAAALEQNEFTKQAIAEIEAKNQRIAEVNKDLISNVSKFFSADNSMENFLEYCNKLITEKLSADGCVILIADDYDNMLAVKSFTGTFPPPYKLPDDLQANPSRNKPSFCTVPA